MALEDIKLEKGPTDKAKEPDPGGSVNTIVQSNRTVTFSVFQLLEDNCFSYRALNLHSDILSSCVFWQDTSL